MTSVTKVYRKADFSRIALLSIALMFSLKANGQENLVVSGTLPATFSNNYFDFEVTVKNLPEEETNKANDETSFYERLVIKVTNTELPYGRDQTDVTGLSTRFYFEEAQSGQVTFDNDNENSVQGAKRYQTVFKVRIRPLTGSTKIEDIVNGDKVDIEVFYYYAFSTTEISKEHTFERVNAIPTDAPEIESLEPTHKSIVVYWTVPDAIGYSDGESRGNPGVNVYVLEEPDVAIDDFRDVNASFAFDPGAEAGTEDEVSPDGEECQYAIQQNDNNCLTCGDNNYLSFSALTENDLAFRFSKQTSSSPITISDLDPEKEYVVFLQYRGRGSGFSSCLRQKPGINYTLSEANGESEAKLSEPQCFIATATYGDNNHPDVELFRQFRDRYLKTNAPGRLLVQLYYTLSPPAAEWLQTQPELQKYIRSYFFEPLAQSLRPMLEK